MTLPESTVAKVREALEAYLSAGHKESRREASVLAKEALQLLSAPPPAMGGLPDWAPKTLFIHNPRTPHHGEISCKHFGCVTVELAAQGTRDRLGELEGRAPHGKTVYEEQGGYIRFDPSSICLDGEFTPQELRDLCVYYEQRDNTQNKNNNQEKK